MADPAYSSSSADTPVVTRLHGWITSVDHKQIGIMYLLMAGMFLILGGFQALMIRLQLWSPDSTLVGPETFNQLFTMHGTTM
ncbi:MAG: cbb3-type cytochrome c oxidase subunit I, partial [Planctomycetales bacterium]